jgi:hypothetical protein
MGDSACATYAESLPSGQNETLRRATVMGRFHDAQLPMPMSGAREKSWTT